MADGSGFLTLLGSYNIFISPICGVSVASLSPKSTGKPEY